MPRVYTRTKSRAGRERASGRCGRTIEPGEEYRQWSFRYGGTYYRCFRPECRPRQSDLTQSKMSEVYGAIESAEDQLPQAENVEAVRDLVAEVAETTRGVAEEYSEAAEQFGGQGENQERAEELESWADELEGFDPDDETDMDEVRSDAAELLGSCPI